MDLSTKVRRYDPYTMYKVNMILQLNPCIYVRDIAEYAGISIGASYNYVRKYVDSNNFVEISKRHRNRLQQSRLLHYLIDYDKDIKVLNVRM